MLKTEILNGNRTMFDWMIIDGNNTAFRAGSVLYLTNPKGDNVSVGYGVLKMIRSLLEDYPSKHVVICWDFKGSKAKLALFPEYKAHRKHDPGDYEYFKILDQINQLQLIIPDFGIKQLKLEGIEGDDLIGVICDELKGQKILVVSGDRDMLQLVSEDVAVYYPSKDVLVRPSNFEELFETKSDWYLYYRNVIGDVQSDGIYGLKGFGPVTTGKLFKSFGPWPDWYDLVGEDYVIKNQVLQVLNKTQKKLLESSEATKILSTNYELMKVGYLIGDEDRQLIRNQFFGQKAYFNEDVVKQYFEDNQFSSYITKFNFWVYPFRKLSFKE
jgi:5'-3' exonuclease